MKRKHQNKNGRKRTYWHPTLLAFSLISFVTLPLLVSSLPAQSVIAIRGGKILTMTGQTINNGIVLIRGSKIAAVGKNVKIPQDAKIVDASGKYVMPGIIDAMTYFGIRPFDLNDTSKPVTPENRIVEAYYPFGEFNRGTGGIEPDREILCGGITTVYIAPGNRQVISGQGAVVKTYGKNFNSLILREPASIEMAIGTPPKQSFKAKKMSPSTRMSLVAHIRKALIEAQEYELSIKMYDKKSAEEKKSATKPKRDLGKEALVQLLNKQIPARIETDLADDIRTALRLAEEFGFDLIIDSGIGAFKLKDVLAERNIPVVLSSITFLYPLNGELRDTREMMTMLDEYNAAKLYQSGVKVAIASFGRGKVNRSKWLLFEAGLHTGYDLPDEEALKAITINAAEILGVDDRVGSLEPGKDADIIILDGPPLNVQTKVENVYIDGLLAYSLKK